MAATGSFTQQQTNTSLTELCYIWLCDFNKL